MTELPRDPVYSRSSPFFRPQEFDLGALRGPVALTGGTGFVGSHLVDSLRWASVELKILIRNPEGARWISGRGEGIIRGSMEESGALERLVEGAGTVMHLAGSLRAPSEAEFMKGNAGGTERLIEAIRDKNPEARLIYCSSQAALGPSEDPGGVGPDAPARPISAYGRSKAAAEDLVRASGLHWMIVRPPAIFGPRDSDVFEFFRMASRGLLAWPAGERLLSIACVDDVLRMLLAVGCNWKVGSTHHVVPCEPIRMEDMLRKIAQGAGRRCRSLAIPPSLLRVAGWGGSALRLLGLRRMPLSRDKIREILARHWVLKQGKTQVAFPALRSLDENIALSWDWYRAISWLPAPRRNRDSRSPS